MALLLRIFRVVLKNLGRARFQSLNEVAVEHFRVFPTDLDLFFHMNHARYFNVMEATRFKFQIRTGFLRLATSKRWIAPIIAIRVRFLRPLKLWQKFETSARIVHMSDDFFVFFHEITSHGKLVSQALVKSTIRKGRDRITPADYLPLLGYENTVAPPENIRAWLEDFIRPSSDA